MTALGVPAKRITGGVANWMKEQAAALVFQWLKEGADGLELILCNNDDMALGAVETLRQEEGQISVSLVSTVRKKEWRQWKRGSFWAR